MLSMRGGSFRVSASPADGMILGIILSAQQFFFASSQSIGSSRPVPDILCDQVVSFRIFGHLWQGSATTPDFCSSTDCRILDSGLLLDGGTSSSAKVTDSGMKTGRKPRDWITMVGRFSAFYLIKKASYKL